DSVEISLAQAGVEGQGERALVAAVGARERALVAVCREAVEGIRADLCLDRLLAQRLEGLVPPVELHNVRLPAVAVALVGGRELDEAREPIGVRGRNPLARLQQLLEPSAPAASSTSSTSSGSASQSSGRPKRWTAITARVRGVTAAPVRSGSRLIVRGSTSTSTGFAPTWATTFAVAGKV